MEDHVPFHHDVTPEAVVALDAQRAAAAQRRRPRAESLGKLVDATVEASTGSAAGSPVAVRLVCGEDEVFSLAPAIFARHGVVCVTRAALSFHVTADGMNRLT